MAVISIPGVSVLLKTGGTPSLVLGQRNASLSVKTDMIDMTVKVASPGAGDLAKIFAAGWYEWSVDCDGLLQAGGAGGIATLVTAQLAGTAVAVSLELTATEKFTGNAIYETTGLDGPNDKEGTYKATLRGTGKLTAVVGT